MTTEIDSLIEQYLQSIHRLMTDLDAHASRQDVVNLINECVVTSEPEPGTHAFFLAEQAFYQGRYKEALRRYLSLAHIPFHPFFCLRASAFLMASLGQRDKALDYAKRALVYQHHDMDTLRLCKELAAPRTDAIETVLRPVTTLNMVEVYSSKGSHYLRWNGLGLVINPTEHFLRLFHTDGLPLDTVSCAMATSSLPEYTTGLQALCDRNGRLPRMHFYLIPTLRESFKPAADDIIHPLESSPSSLTLSDWVTLHHFHHETETGWRISLSPSNLDSDADDKIIQIGIGPGSLKECDIILHCMI